MRPILILPVILLTLTLALAVPQSASARANFTAPKLYAVALYADWCSACKVLDPKVKEAIEEGSLLAKDILFVTMDFTDKPRIHQSKMLARELGLEWLLTKIGSKTGYIVLVNPETQSEIIRIYADSEIADILKTFEDALALSAD